MFRLEDGCGLEKNFISHDHLSKTVDVMKTFNMQKPVDESKGNLYGIDLKHPLYKWFINDFFVLLKDYTGRPDLKLIFGMYADLNKSFTIHKDIKDIPESNPNCKQFASFLLPITVDHCYKKCKENSTIIFEELPEPELNSDYYWHKKIPQTESMHQYKLKKEIFWEPCGLIWWNSLLPHCGIDLNYINASSKQMIVVHTYV